MTELRQYQNVGIGIVGDVIWPLLKVKNATWVFKASKREPDEALHTHEDGQDEQETIWGRQPPERDTGNKMFLTFFFVPLWHKKTIFSQKKFFLRSVRAREVAREISQFRNN